MAGAADDDLRYLITRSIHNADGGSHWTKYTVPWVGRPLCGVENRGEVGWTKEEVRMLKTLAREKTKTTVIARKLKRSVASTYQRASKLGVMLGGGRGRKRV